MNTKKGKSAMYGTRMHSFQAAKNQPSIVTEGLVAGLIGAGTIAVWFLILDAYFGRPFFTPNLLGRALFLGGIDPNQIGILPLSFRMVLVFTWIHVMVFCAIGVAAAWLIQLAARDRNYGFGVILLAVIFEFGFIAVSMAAAEIVLHALTLPAILIGNLLAIATMSLYFWRRHPKLTFFP
jgi:hypothetical protein